MVIDAVWDFRWRNIVKGELASIFLYLKCLEEAGLLVANAGNICRANLSAEHSVGDENVKTTLFLTLQVDALECAAVPKGRIK